MNSVNLKAVVKRPYVVASLAAAALVALGTTGIITRIASGALRTPPLLAIPGAVTAADRTAASAKVVQRRSGPSGPRLGG